MSSYPISVSKSNPYFLTPTHSGNTKEYNESHNDFCLNEEIVADKFGGVKKYYRLHSKQPHNTEMALAYDVKCPHCNGILKPVGRMLNANNLFLYECRNCGK